MPTTYNKAYTLPGVSRGVGRRDYSQQVEYSVEPIIRSYQEPYLLDAVYALGALVGTTATNIVTIDTDTVVLLYDFVASQNAANLFNFQVIAVDVDGTESSIFSKWGSQRVEHHHSRGAPVYKQIKIVLTNGVAGGPFNIYVTIAGIKTSDETYYQKVT